MELRDSGGLGRGACGIQGLSHHLAHDSSVGTGSLLIEFWWLMLLIGSYLRGDAALAGDDGLADSNKDGLFVFVSQSVSTDAVVLILQFELTIEHPEAVQRSCRVEVHITHGMDAGIECVSLVGGYIVGDVERDDHKGHGRPREGV